MPGTLPGGQSRADRKRAVGDRASHNARSPGGLLGRYRRGFRAEDKTGAKTDRGGQSHFRGGRVARMRNITHAAKIGTVPLPVGQQETANCQRSAGRRRARACLPAASVVGRISIRPRNAGRIRESALRQWSDIVDVLISYPLAQFPAQSPRLGDQNLLLAAGCPTHLCGAARFSGRTIHSGLRAFPA